MEMSNENRAPGCLGYRVILPIFVGIIINHRKDAYETTRIAWKVRSGFFCESPEFLNLQKRLLMAEIRRSPVEVGSLSNYLQGFIHQGWCRISAINRMTRT